MNRKHRGGATAPGGATRAAADGGVVRRLITGLAALLSVAMVASLTACGSDTVKVDVPDELRDGTLKIAAATELEPLAPLIEQASDDLGFDIELSFPDGTLANSHELADGGFDGVYDATWFATNRYVELLGASGKIDGSTSIATSPVAFGVRTEKARELGWDQAQPTWAEIVDAAASGDFTFGMTNPATSNSGFSAGAAVATSLADTGNALTSEDIADNADRLREFFSGQTLTAGSSGWLADAFLDDPQGAAGLINYESTLYSMIDEGADITVVIPSDGVISADYPLSALAGPEDDLGPGQVEVLATWLEKNADRLADYRLRPTAAADLPPEMTRQVLIELPFPGDMAVADRFIEAYDNELRKPGETVFVLDTSGSMAGQRIEDLKRTMHSLIDGTARTRTGTVGLRDREKVSILPFSDKVGSPTTVEFGSPESEATLSRAVDDLETGQLTALYNALVDAYDMTEERHGRIPSIVLLSDGQATAGLNFAKFREWYEAQDRKLPPTFVIRYGEASPREMAALADLTGGKVFEAGQTDLGEAFKEIRGYQ